MEPHWVNICEREPESDKVVQVLVLKDGSAFEYVKARASNRGWVSLTGEISGQIVAWLESDRFLDANELHGVPKNLIRAQT